MCKRRSSVANKKRTKNKINGFARAFTMALQHPSHFYPNAFDFQFVSTPFAQMNFSCCISLEPFNALFISSSHHLALSRSISFRFLCNFLCVVCSFYLLVTDAKNSCKCSMNNIIFYLALFSSLCLVNEANIFQQIQIYF